MLNKWIPLSLCRAETPGIKLRLKYRDAATDRIARAILESQEIFNQTFGMPGAIYIECHDEEIMRGREEARESSLSPPAPISATPHGDGVGSARVLEGTLLSVTYQ